MDVCSMTQAGHLGTYVSLRQALAMRDHVAYRFKQKNGVRVHLQLLLQFFQCSVM